MTLRMHLVEMEVTEAGGAGLAAAEVKLRDYRSHTSPSPVPSREAAHGTHELQHHIHTFVALVPRSQPKAYAEFPSKSDITYHSLR